MSPEEIAERWTQRLRVREDVCRTLSHALESKTPPKHVDLIAALLQQFGMSDELSLVKRVLSEFPGIVDAERLRAAATDIEARTHFRPSPDTAFEFLVLHHRHRRQDHGWLLWRFSNRLDVTSREVPRRVKDPYSLPRVQAAIGERCLRALGTVIEVVYREQHAPEPWHIVRGDDFDARIEAAFIQRILPTRPPDAAAPVTRWQRWFSPPPSTPEPDPEHLTKAFALLARDFREWVLTAHDGEFYLPEVLVGDDLVDAVMIRYREEEGITGGIIECMRST